MSTQPVYPGSVGAPNTGVGGGGTDWTSWLPMLLNFGGNLLGGISNSQNQKNALQLQAQEFGQTMDMARKSQAMQAAQALNKLPLADRGQYLATHFAAPTAFQPRDYTRGLSQIGPGSTPQGGAAAQLAANAATSANYRPGAGGVKPDTLNWILGSTGAPNSGQSSTSTMNYGGKQYTPQQWSDFLNQHPEIAAKGL